MPADASRQSGYSDSNTFRRLVSLPTEFSTICADKAPRVLAQTYRLRYRVYCEERAFLPATGYPDGLEIDQFDRYATHLATVDSQGQVVGTVRLVHPSILGLPLFRHCVISPDETELFDPCNSVAEVSRLSVSRQYRPRGYGDHRNGRSTLLGDARGRAASEAVVFSLYRTLYQVSKQAGLTHWVVATEAALQRAVASYGFPFRRIGPEIDYFGPVAPYLMDLSAFDRLILSRTIPKLEGFLDDLEEPYRPRLEGG